MCGIIMIFPLPSNLKSCLYSGFYKQIPLEQGILAFDFCFLFVFVPLMSVSLPAISGFITEFKGIIELLPRGHGKPQSSHSLALSGCPFASGTAER